MRRAHQTKLSQFPLAFFFFAVCRWKFPRYESPYKGRSFFFLISCKTYFFIIPLVVAFLVISVCSVAPQIQNLLHPCPCLFRKTAEVSPGRNGRPSVTDSTVSVRTFVRDIQVQLSSCVPQTANLEEGRMLVWTFSLLSSPPLPPPVSPAAFFLVHSFDPAILIIVSTATR